MRRAIQRVRVVGKFVCFLMIISALAGSNALGKNSDRVEGTEGAKDLKQYIAGKSYNVGTQWIVIADPHWVEDKIGVVHVIAHVIKLPTNPILQSDLPWEDSINWPYVIYDKKAGVYHMWYCVGNWAAFHAMSARWSRRGEAYAQKQIAMALKKHWYAYFIGYATSQDGIHWVKPDLNEYSYLHFSKTNICWIGNGDASEIHVWLNQDQSDPERRFLMVYSDNVYEPSGTRRVLNLAYSADGMHWKLDEKASPLLGPTQDVPDGSWDVLYDKATAQWLMFRRPYFNSAAVVEKGHYAVVRPNGRFGISTNTKLGPGWSYPRLLFVPDEEVERRDIDTMHVIREGTDYLAFLGEADERLKGVESVHLAVSHDGFHWTRFPYLPPLIPRGAKGSWDAGQTQPCTAVNRGEWTYLYYAGSNVPQNVQAGYSGNIGMARIPRGRWIGLKSDVNGGYVLTRELIVSGDQLEVNFQGILVPYMKPIENNTLGYIRVELLRRSNTTQTLNPIPGYTFKESDPLVGDGQSTVVTWNGNADLSRLKGTAIYIRFHVVNSELWEVRFAPSED